MNLLLRFILLFFLICPIACRHSKEPLSAQEQMSKIESEIGLTFPPDSIVEHFYELEVFVDPVWVAKVFVPVSAYESLKPNLLAKSTDDSTYINALADSTSWWQPVNVVLTKQYWTNSHTFVRVVVSEEDGKIAIYIECAVF